jgi:hypothetical protein
VAKRGKVAPKYFVPAPRAKAVPESPSRRTVPVGEKEPVAGTKYFKRSYPLPVELPEVWAGAGPDLPPGYEGAEGCPDCSAFRGQKHLPLCIRNPAGTTWNLATTWAVIRTREQIFFGAGHPIISRVDDYMTEEKQRRLSNLGVVVMYDKMAGVRSVDAEREVIASWRVRHGKFRNGGETVTGKFINKITRSDVPPGAFDFFNDFDNWSKGREDESR